MKALSVCHVKKTYRNGVQALKDISFEVQGGDFFALLGPNGAGKSTLIGILTSLVRKTAGHVQIFDADIDHNFIKAKSYLGVVPQEFNFNVFERVLDVMTNQAGYYGVSYSESVVRAEKYLRQFGLWGKRFHAVRTLSGGLKRRLMIARALVHEPRLLILDEPTAGTDLSIRRSLWEFLSELNKSGLTIILTTHYLEEAENLCRTLAIINSGEIIIHTTVSSILKKLDTEKFILYLEQSLSQLPTLIGYSISLYGENALEVEVPKKLGLTPLFQQLAQQNIQVSSMRNKSNRLEEVFLKLTGDNATGDNECI